MPKGTCPACGVSLYEMPHVACLTHARTAKIRALRAAALALEPTPPERQAYLDFIRQSRERLDYEYLDL